MQEYNRVWTLDEEQDIKHAVARYARYQCGLDWPVDMIAVIRLDINTFVAFCDTSKAAIDTDKATASGAAPLMVG
jgi:hypothetical protein